MSRPSEGEHLSAPVAGARAVQRVQRERERFPLLARTADVGSRLAGNPARGQGARRERAPGPAAGGLSLPRAPLLKRLSVRFKMCVCVAANTTIKCYVAVI